MKITRLPFLGGGWSLRRAWLGKTSAILRATQWFAMIMHSATVSWMARCALGRVQTKIFVRENYFFLQTFPEETTANSLTKNVQK
jgi:hypothetical protein